MADVECGELREVLGPCSGSIDRTSTFGISSPPQTIVEFKCDEIDVFLNSFAPESDMVAEAGTRACAGPFHSSRVGCHSETADFRSPIAERPSELSSSANEQGTDPLLTPLVRNFDVPKSITLFNMCLLTASNHHNRKSLLFMEKSSETEIEELISSRVPSKLISCYESSAALVPSLPSDGKDSAELEKPDQLLPDVPTETKNKVESELNVASETTSSQTPLKTRRKRRKQRFSLLEMKKLCLDDGRERDILVPDAYDLKTTYSKIHAPHNIPFVYRCKEETAEHDCAVECAKFADKFKLYMSVGPNSGSPLSPIVRENILSNLDQNSTHIDLKSALMAATALRVKNQPNFSVFLPVSDHLIERIPAVREIQDDKLPLRIKVEIDEVVRSILDEIVDFVDRQLNETEPDFDPDCHEMSSVDSINESSLNLSASLLETSNPDSAGPSRTSTPEIGQEFSSRRRRESNRVIRELRKLVNISVTDERFVRAEKKHDYSGVCPKPYCSLGCVCESLNVKPLPPDHCGNSDCVFGCVCGERSRYAYVPVGELAKNEKSWHQTVVRKADDCLEIQSGIERSKRAKKPPERFDDWNPGPGRGSRSMRKRDPTLDDKEPKMNAYKKTYERTLPNPAKKVKNTKQENVVAETESEKRQSKVSKLLEVMQSKGGDDADLNRAIRKISLARRLCCCKNAGKSVKSLADVFIYCSIHKKYDCDCDGWIVMLKNGDLLLKADLKQSKMLEDVLKNVSLSSIAGFRKKAMLYDMARHSARTADPIIDYVTRNKSKVFKKKSSVTLRFNVTSYSNGFVKVPPIPLLSYCEDEPAVIGPSFSGTDAIETGVGKVVHIVNHPPNENTENDSFQVEDRKILAVSRASAEPPAKMLKPNETENAITTLNLQDVFGPPRKTLKLHDVSSSRRKNSSEKSIKIWRHKDDSDESDVSEGRFSIVDKPDRDHKYYKKIRVTAKKQSMSTAESQTDRSVHHPQISGGVVLDLSVLDEAPVAEKRLSEVAEKLGCEPPVDEGTSTFENSEDSIVISDDDENEDFPKFGLFCQSHPHLGYVKLDERSNGHFAIKGFGEQIDKLSFSDIKQAGEFMRKILLHSGEPEYARSNWIKVTKGVLQLKKCKKFDPTPFARPKSSIIVKKIENRKEKKTYSGRSNRNSSTPSSSPAKDDDIPSVDLTDDDQSSEKIELATSSEKPSALKTSPTKTAASPIVQSVTTFPNMVEAQAYIQSLGNRAPAPAQKPLLLPAASTYFIRPLFNQPVTAKPCVTSAQSVPSASVVLPNVVRTPSSTKIVAMPKKPSPAIVTFGAASKHHPVVPPVVSSPSAAVIIPSKDRTIKILGPPSAKIMPVCSSQEKKITAAYLCDKKQLSTAPVKSLLINRKREGE